MLLAPQAALHIALISYELGTNARKCGSLSAPRGELHVGWRIETRGEARVLHLTWAERDGPAASLRSAPPSARSDGLLTLWRIWHFDELFVEL